ncbi:MAG: hypothetical protein LBG43_10085 [Treponema sp.]|jgi:hypothetical protein|nr:hypothetical protein [Treponema sp.]
MPEFDVRVLKPKKKAARNAHHGRAARRVKKDRAEDAPSGFGGFEKNNRCLEKGRVF